MHDHDIRPIRAGDTRPLRHQVLRPHQPPEALVYPGDDHPLALHVGAFDGNDLVGIASVAPEAYGPEPGVAAWRLRGMAILPRAQRRGYGAALLQACVEHIRAQGGALLWCNGRTSALPFYRALGFVPQGEEFLDPATGPHYVCIRRLSEPDS
jgi:GNAT superfamily N-acetyltransferase